MDYTDRMHDHQKFAVICQVADQPSAGARGVRILRWACRICTGAGTRGRPRLGASSGAGVAGRTSMATGWKLRMRDEAVMKRWETVIPRVIGIVAGISS